MKKIIILPVLLLCAALVFSADFGLLLDQKAEAGNNAFMYTPSLIPWLSLTGMQDFSLYCSGILSMEYRNLGKGNDDSNGWLTPILRPELAILSLCYRSGSFAIEAGRIRFNDALAVTANGQFDGFRFQLGSLSISAFYTGLLSKETAKIFMTAADALSYAEAWDWDTVGKCFASKRLMASLRWDMPLLEFHNLSFEALVQIDLNDSEEKLHSQYGEALLELYAVGSLGINTGVFLETMESGTGDFAIAFGALANLKFDVPGSLNDSLLLTAKFSSGSWNDTINGFIPVSSIDQGAVFPGTVTGLALFRAGYDIRIMPSLFGEASAAYFISTYDVPGADGKALGGELWAAAAWQPFDDMRLNAGFGVFIPGLGNMKYNDNKVLWKLSTGLSISL